MNKGLTGFGTTWGWVINDRIFGWTIPLIFSLSWNKALFLSFLDLGSVYIHFKEKSKKVVQDIWKYINKQFKISLNYCFKI